ncbi:endolytic transglycosylase MltG [Neiella marina]|uniref:Endolytic murein transglycosylase n=1 Tax=Neiella holothuriorum TaxID=2870530 RepID=A0ABS7ELP5_9GAMM|nr:endolytic transglycosylase MltG [Neiella holothuriorum]MBW8192607.1 endolytic transglycosylase MltG [Neiella holothuriorum]
MKAKFVKLAMALAVAALIAGVAGYWWLNQQIDDFANQRLTNEQAELITIRPGQSVYALVKQWQKHQWIGEQSWLRWLLRQQPELGAIRAGTYQLTPGQTLANALQHLVAGQEHQFAITFVEGSRWWDWQAQIKQAEHLTGAVVVDDEAALRQRLAIEQASIEGWLYPDTYFYTAGTSAEELLQRAHRRMVEVLNNAWQQRNDEAVKHLESAYQALTLASIIEKETGQHGERALISSVFHNRLDANMRLQTDPTVIYGMGERYDGNIRKTDLREATPYNTYVIKGLPPTPIAMAGKAAIEAALAPETSELYYFVSRGDGSHVFSKNLAEHNANVRRYILNKTSNKE